MTDRTIMLSLGHWLRPPRHVVTLFLGVTGSLLLAMGWLAWQLAAQDRSLAAQRTQERLDNAAETAVAALRHGLEDLAQRLDAFSKLPPGDAPAEFAEQGSMLGDDAALILAGDRTFDAWPAGGLVLVMPATGGEARELLRVDGEKEAPGWGSPWWTPDGLYVSFLKGVKGEAPNEWHLWRVAAEGGKPQQLGLTVGRQWGGLRPHPDGRRLATTDIKVNLEVWVMENFLPEPPAVPGAKPR